MKRICRFNKQITCDKPGKRTKIDCLQCILARKERAYAELLQCITLNVEVSIGNAGYVYGLLNRIYVNNNEFRKWVGKYHPEKLIPQPQPNIEKQLERFSKNEPGGIVVCVCRSCGMQLTRLKMVNSPRKRMRLKPLRIVLLPLRNARSFFRNYVRLFGLPRLLQAFGVERNA